METLSAAALETQLRWRYACKKFDPERKIPAADWSALEQALILTPSSFGLQPWRFVVVTDPAVREQLHAASWRQAQVRDASHLVIFAIRKPLTVDYIERYVDHVSHVRGASRESLARFRQSMLGFLEHPPEGVSLDDWASRQVYIALGNFMTAAAVMGIDTCPLEGLEPAKYDAILELSQASYATVVACAAGYRSADDRNATLPKVRFPTEEMIDRR
jgi:nitroreductase